jgi:alpha-N-acetylglucosamine transferase
VNIGVIYSCKGSIRFLTEAIESAKTVRKFLPHVKICLFHGYDDHTIKNVNCDIFTDIKKINLPNDIDKKFQGHMSGFLSKLYAIQQSPFDYTLFLDTDTEIRKPIMGLFKLLNNFDIALAPGPMTQAPIDEDDILSEVPREFPELNTGVILYKKSDKMKAFLEEWKNVFLNNEKGLYRPHGKGGEQVALRYLLWTNTQIRMYILSSSGMPNMYNFRWGPLSKEFNFKNQVVIHHTRNRQP